MTTTIATARPAPPTDATTERPAEPRRSRVRRAVALGLLISAQFTVMLDTSIVNVALPSLQSDLGLGPAGVAWVINAYVLAFGWQAVFKVTVPVSVTGVLLAHRVLADGPRGSRHRFDALGAVTVTGAVVALVHGALGLAESGLSVTTGASLAVAAALAGAFVAVERRSAEPLVPLDLFSDRTVGTGVGLAVLGGAARASSFVLVALYLQQALGLDPQHAGLAMVPTSVTGFVVSLTLLPRILRALGPQRSLVLGLVMLAGGHLWLAYAPSDAGYAVAVLPGLLLVASGVAFSFTPTTMVIAGAMPDAHAGLASGLAGSATQVGSALGTSVFTAIGIAVGGTAAGSLGAAGFTAAFTAAATVSLGTAALGLTLVGRASGHRAASAATPGAKS
jgi:predicted MFS family arabinose efflux permease